MKDRLLVMNSLKRPNNKLALPTSYGAVGEKYILSTGHGSHLAGGSWINTGEGGVAPILDLVSVLVI
jgi:hypothetical protein